MCVKKLLRSFLPAAVLELRERKNSKREYEVFWNLIFFLDYDETFIDPLIIFTI